ncbi:CCA tRNA nucleotidyltransferase [Cereibacter sphaeroides]|uniref:CCA tRNA nucleotidyltransferase n=1 Tax=Cereibacter sphaeroides TaxID=1063 RepID=UPI001F20EB82|nr:CCA tRNA nucleotidyltransferase [Cereibacter sphaeroides]MCE6959215.1 CCA tRNA nucleotidyltransferase [Cereibacter sphaeroides]MCE6972018.1 CCA tRNA nucleotidyltransferase [Cereibacter sphaeroides]
MRTASPCRLNAAFLDDQAVLHLLDGLVRGGERAFVVGGAVRNALLGLPATDVDIATTATPDVVTRLFEAEGLQVVPTGIDHGTVTVVVDGVPHEITTFRRDVATDGRRAAVAFSTDIREDAERRDFTVNALYCDRAGRVLDPTGEGLDDLENRRLRFVGLADTRIREDALRILRYFRFRATLGIGGDGWSRDDRTMQVLRDRVELVDGLSRERIGAEMRKLLAAPVVLPVLQEMEDIGLLGRILPGPAPLDLLARLESSRDPRGGLPGLFLRLAILSPEDPARDLRLSRKDCERLRATSWGASIQGAGEAGYRLGKDIGGDALMLCAARGGPAFTAERLAELETGAAAVFPVRAADLPPRLKGRAIGEALARLERDWIGSGFQATRASLLGLEPDVLLFTTETGARVIVPVEEDPRDLGLTDAQRLRIEAGERLEDVLQEHYSARGWISHGRMSAEAAMRFPGGPCNAEDPQQIFAF